jgi:hypothetical protein
MTYPMPPELLEQLGLEPCAATEPHWPEDHDALGWGRPTTTTTEVGETRAERPARTEAAK